MYTGIYGKNNCNLSYNVHIKQQLVVVKCTYNNYNVTALYTHCYVILYYIVHTVLNNDTITCNPNVYIYMIRKLARRLDCYINYPSDVLYPMYTYVHRIWSFVYI